VYLTDNNSRDGERIMVQLGSEFSKTFLTLRSELSPHSQLKVYAWCAEEKRSQHNWMAFLDLDEFLVLQRRCAQPSGAG
jgi:hypothetical protein